MPITLGLNLSSLKARRQLDSTETSLASTFERLSSGQRINRASDDAAGLSVADSLRSDSRVFNQGVRNLNDGISLLNIADSAVENLSSIVIRLKELAEQAANGALGVTQRSSLDDEAQALKAEYFRIAQSAEFNDQKILSGDFGSLALQAGYGIDGVIGQGLGGAIGDGTLKSAQSYTVGSSDYMYAEGDFNGDGNIDLVATDNGDDAVHLLLGTGTGALVAAGSFDSGSTFPTGITTGDYNQDGFLDVAYIDRNDQYGLLFGNGDGTFQSAQTFALAETAQTFEIVTADFDGDGADDLLYTNSSTDDFHVLLNDGDGTFGTSLSFAVGNPYSIESTIGVTDFNGDGIIDIGFVSGTDETIQLFSGVGDGSFTSIATISLTETPNSFVFADFTGDGNVDFMVTHPIGQFLSLYEGDGSGNFSYRSPDTTDASMADPRGIAAGDLNGDGAIDVAVSDNTNNTINLFLNNGDGTFSNSGTYAVGDGGLQVLLTDFNNDGVLDVATRSADLDILLGNTVDGVAPLLDFSLESVVEAKQALSMFTHKLEQLSEQRGEIGAFESRLHAAKNVLSASSESFQSAESRIRDADIAQETANLTRLSILQQAASAIISQANQQPAIAIQLLQ